MRIFSTAILAAVITLAHAPAAQACGGCFHAQQSESTQVIGHRMALSIGTTRTTLWDQIRYSGEPSSFAWVLPIKGKVDVGLSSDALFANLEEQTRVVIESPSVNCTPKCVATGGDVGVGGGGHGDDPPVTVLAQGVVGPYETVQLAAADPGALKTWLLDHGYAIPPEISPIVDAYVNEGFGFLALKLVPGKGVDAMRPVRVTSPGATPVLPLRMVAAGTGALTPITLWVLAEGRYGPTNAPAFEIDRESLVWNWDTQSSNYTFLRQAGFAASKNKGWLIEDAEPFSAYTFSGLLTSLAQDDPKNSGYADAMGQGAIEACQADLEVLFGDLDETSLWVTRMSGELSRAALSQDLTLGATSAQTQVARNLLAAKTVGQACPPDTSCDGLSGSSYASDGAPDSGCAMGRSGGVSALVALALAGAMGATRRRRAAAGRAKISSR